MKKVFTTFCTMSNKSFIIIIICLQSAFCTDEMRGYLVYCPCMGRFGNQADHFLGALAFTKTLNRTLILPPWVEYRYGEIKSIQVPFDTYFDIEHLQSYTDVILMETFMNQIAPEIWPINKRISFCYGPRMGGTNNSCNAKSGNPFQSFWDTYNVEFVQSEFYSPLNYDIHNMIMIKKWIEKYPVIEWPVLAFTGAPASFPAQEENIYLQKYLHWSNVILKLRNIFIKKNFVRGGYLGIHLRNGADWNRACEHVKETSNLFASPQCIGYKNERGSLTMSMCYPEKSTIIKQVKRVLKRFNNIKHVFVASDANHMINELSKALRNMNIDVVRSESTSPHLDLAILGHANYFIGNCVSSFTAFAKRERDIKGLPSEFWSNPSSESKRKSHDEL